MELFVIAGAAFIGWRVVSWLFDRQTPSQPADESLRPAESPPATSDELSLMEVSERWSAILGVSRDASDIEIEHAYQSAIAECDRARFSDGASLTKQAEATARRSKVEAAYEFIRKARRQGL